MAVRGRWDAGVSCSEAIREVIFSADKPLRTADLYAGLLVGYGHVWSKGVMEGALKKLRDTNQIKTTRVGSCTYFYEKAEGASDESYVHLPAVKFLSMEKLAALDIRELVKKSKTKRFKSMTEDEIEEFIAHFVKKLIAP